MKEAFSWSKDVITKLLREIATEVEKKVDFKNKLHLAHQVNDLALLATASSGLRSKKTSSERSFFLRMLF